MYVYIHVVAYIGKHDYALRRCLPLSLSNQNLYLLLRVSHNRLDVTLVHRLRTHDETSPSCVSRHACSLEDEGLTWLLASLSSTPEYRGVASPSTPGTVICSASHPEPLVACTRRAW